MEGERLKIVAEKLLNMLADEYSYLSKDEFIEFMVGYTDLTEEELIELEGK